MDLLNELRANRKMDVVTTQPVGIYTKTLTSYSNCWDILNNDNLELDNIDESYGLDVVELPDRFDVYIPKGAKCVIIHGDNPNVDCTIRYKNIECDLIFEDEPIDSFFEPLND